LLLPPPPRSTLFPYTTLFRSQLVILGVVTDAREVAQNPRQRISAVHDDVAFEVIIGRVFAREREQRIGEFANVFEGLHIDVRLRSEEHTSELQSRGHLVCRLL